MNIILSIRPKYAELILSKKKTYEFRRVIFKYSSKSKVFIYATSPISLVIGEFNVDDVLYQNTKELWINTKQHAGIDKDYFDSYFHGKTHGYAIKIKSPTRYKTYKKLSEFSIKHAPQSFIYIE